MNENVKKEETLSAKTHGNARHAIAFLILIALFVAVGFWSFGLGKKAPNDSALEPLAALEARVVALEKKAESFPQGDGALSPNEANADIYGKLQALETKLDETLLSKNKTGDEKAVVLSFVRLRMAAMTGFPFDDSVKDFRRFSNRDEAMDAFLNALEPLAREGVSTVSSLGESWHGARLRAQAAVKKAAATTWREKILAMLETLVSIKTENSEKTGADAFDAIAQDLEHGKISSALERIAGLPKEAQPALEEWCARAKARAEVEKLLDALHARLVGEQEGGNS